MKTPVVDHSTGLNHKTLKKYCFAIDTAKRHYEGPWMMGTDEEIEAKFFEEKEEIETTGITLRIEK